jgi:hypothetical protein
MRARICAVGPMGNSMAKLGALVALAWIVMLATVTPSAAGCVCKDTRTTWCAKTCYVCYSNRAVPTGSCSYWLDKRKHRRTRDAGPS